MKANKGIKIKHGKTVKCSKCSNEMSKCIADLQQDEEKICITCQLGIVRNNVTIKRL
jgi:hypothetical protein